MTKLISCDEFKKKYNIEDHIIEKANIQWSELEKIYDEYDNIRKKFLPTAKYIVEILLNEPNVHSVKYRLKDSEHLIEKIIRKRAESQRDINSTNYLDEINDLIGIRVLHLFKEDWESIHDFIIGEWDLVENAKANIREGDSELIKNKYKEKECDINIHKAGYRSVHYLITSNSTKKQFTAEIQVRTIFEEAWSEIDHRIRYPYNTKDKVLSTYLEIFNRLAGSADEMGSYINFLNKSMVEKDNTYLEKLKEQEEIIAKQQREIERLKRQKVEVINLVSKNTKYAISSLNTTNDKDISSGIFIDNLKNYIMSSATVDKLNNLAENAGFNMYDSEETGEIEEHIIDLSLHLEEIKIQSIDELDEFIKSCLPDAQNYFIKLKNATKDNWTTESCFNIILLIVLKNLDKFTYEVLTDNLGWYFNTAYRVLQVAEEWSEN